MKSIIKLNITIEVIADSQEEVDEILNDPKTIVAEECFTKLGRRIVEALIIESEMIDQDVSNEQINQMLDQRISGGEKPITKEPEL